MNSFSGGPAIPFSGLDEAGKPKLDFRACDEFFPTAKECGFTKPVYAYDGPAMVEGLNQGGWEQKTGKPLKELLPIVWNAVREHAAKEGWLTVNYGFIDEPRVLEPAQQQLALLKAYRESVPFVRTGGFYSVDWSKADPLHAAIQDLFRTMTWSGLNLWTQVDLEKGKELGREVHIYNQGITRYTFGAYQWAAMQKGVRGRMQWHLLALHGYQFFDLDGREPDTAMINWGRSEIIPTIHLARCAEGAADFRLAVTLWNAAQKRRDSAAGQAAIGWLEDVGRRIAPGQRERPQGFMDDETFRETCAAHLKTLAGK